MKNIPNKQSITFNVDKVRTQKKLIPQTPIAELMHCNLGKHVTAFGTNHTELIHTQSHALVMALHHSYAEHYPLVLSPDHIWLTICQGFARHMTLYGEVLREDIVHFEGKKQLLVTHPDFRRDNPDNQWDEIFPAFSEQMRQHIGDDLHELLTPIFSTTTPIETAAYAITMMEAMQPYFDYAITLCGIPSITLEGTSEDWRMLLKRVRRFRTYNLRWWSDQLEPILKQFIYAVEGRVDREFWSNIYKQEDGSGGPYITGWILKLFPYIGDAKNPTRNPYVERDPEPDKWMQGLTMRAFPSGLSSAAVKCNDGVEAWDVSFIAGFFGISQDTKTAALRPEISWAVRDETAVIEARKQARLALRQEKQIWMPATFRVEKKHLMVQFKDGVFYIGEQVLWERDGNPARTVQDKQIDFNIWRKKEYANLVYAYDPQLVPSETALTVMQSHESKMAQYELMPERN
jgi:hypothetical protein